MDNLEDMILNIEKVFAYLKNKKMLQRKENNPNREIIIIQYDTSYDETPSFDDTSSNGSSSDETYYEDSTKKSKITARKCPIKELLKSKILNLDHPAGIFVNHRTSLFECDFVLLDSKLESIKSTMDISFSLGSAEEVDNLKILQSCNGLLLCSGSALPAFNMLHRGRNFLHSFGGSVGSNNPIDDICSREFTIYGMMKGRYVRTVSYLVNTDGFMTSLSERWSIRSTVWSIGLGEREEDSFLIPDLTQENPRWITPLVPLRKLIMLGSCSLEMVCFCVLTGRGLLFITSVVLRMAFDPRKSFDYKVVQAGRTPCNIEIQIYSSETGNWSLCMDCFNYFICDHFDSAIYWNDAFHWLETNNRQLKNYKLNIEYHDYSIITTIQIPHGLHRGRNFLQSFKGNSNDLVLILMEIPQMLHLEGKFFESHGFLLLVCRDDISSIKITNYGMMKGCSVWSVRYLVNIEEFVNPLPERWSIRSTVWSIGLGEREDDSFLVINLYRKVVKYNLISKTINEIFNIGCNQMHDDDDDDDQFIPTFLVDLNVYDFIPSFVSV
ncbi:hypothetical protein Tco_0891802 [Tanacetum coccineum]|uniref:F-box protein n=1 Tax=Tanacetum coccineum TaxID=301880 RepID=A0ABQ5C3Z8_9ASTR